LNIFSFIASATFGLFIFYYMVLWGESNEKAQQVKVIENVPKTQHIAKKKKAKAE